MATATPLHLRAVPDDAHPLLRALDRAPVGAPLSPEEEAECAAALEDLRSGRVQPIPHAEAQATIARMRREQQG